MKKRPVFKNFKDEIDERVSNNLFYKFVVILFLFYLFIIVSGEAFYSNYSYVSIYGVSMQNTLNPDIDRMSLNEQDKVQDGVILEYTRDVNYGDIVILTSSVSSKHGSIIKRALAFEGDYVSIIKINIPNIGMQYRVLRVKKNTSRVEVLEEDYIKDYREWSNMNIPYVYNGVAYEHDFYNTYFTGNYNTTTLKVNDMLNSVLFFEVPEDNIYFMGDNRAYSTDARVLGTYNVEAINGRVVEIVRNGSFNKNKMWWFYRMVSFVKVCWREIMIFFGAKY